MTEQQAIERMRYRIDTATEIAGKGEDGNAFEDMEMAINALEKQIENAWNILTDDEESYPECFEYVLIEDDIGDKNVACCYPDYDWYISNGENSLKLIGEVIKWRRLN